MNWRSEKIKLIGLGVSYALLVGIHTMKFIALDVSTGLTH